MLLKFIVGKETIVCKYMGQQVAQAFVFSELMKFKAVKREIINFFEFVKNLFNLKKKI